MKITALSLLADADARNRQHVQDLSCRLDMLVQSIQCLVPDWQANINLSYQVSQATKCLEEHGYKYDDASIEVPLDSV